MSKRDLYNRYLDTIWTSPDERRPGFRVEIWNPNRTTVQQVVLGKPESPAYDITNWVVSVQYSENIVFENSDDAVAGTIRLQVVYDPDASPIPISDETLVDGTPIRLYQGDTRIRHEDWPVVFTGTIRGNPSVEMFSRKAHGNAPKTMDVVAFDRAEQFINRVIVGRNYDYGADLGKACVETAIEHLGLKRREIGIGEQGYTLGHSKNQLVDIECLKGIYELLFPVGKKPKFDSNGKLIAADTDLEKPPVRVHDDLSLVESITREQRLESVNNSVSLLGLSNVLTVVEQREQRLALCTITSGYFETVVDDIVHLSDDQTRKAKDTYLVVKRELGISGDAEWTPHYESDGETVLWGKLRVKTGFLPHLTVLLIDVWALAALMAWNGHGNDDVTPPPGGAEAAEGAAGGFDLVGMTWSLLAVTSQISILLTMMKLGRGKYEVWGTPFEHVYQQLKSVAQVDGLLTEDVREIEYRNDLLYDIDYMDTRAKELLKRELVKGHMYRISMLDDPVLEVDDILEIDGRKYYIVSIEKTLQRAGGQQLMALTAWRIS